MKKMTIVPLFLAFMVFISTAQSDGREFLLLKSDWKFLKRDIAPDQNAEEWRNFQMPPWEVVTIPHTWNAVDGAN